MLEDSSFVSASTDAERTSLEEKSRATSDWLYGDGASAPRDELKSKLKELKDIVSPIEKRREESAKRPEQIKLLQDALEQTKSFIGSVRGQIEKDASSASSVVVESPTSSKSQPTTTSNDFEGLEDEETSTSTSTTTSQSAASTPIGPSYTEEDVAPVQEAYDTIASWLTTKIAEQDALPETADPVLLVKDLAERADTLQKVGMELVMKAMKVPPKSSSSKSKKSKTKSSKKPKKTQAASSANSESAEVPQGTDTDDGVEGAHDKDHKIDEL